MEGNGVNERKYKGFDNDDICIEFVADGSIVDSETVQVANGVFGLERIAPS